MSQNLVFQQRQHGVHMGCWRWDPATHSQVRDLTSTCDKAWADQHSPKAAKTRPVIQKQDLNVIAIKVSTLRKTLALGFKNGWVSNTYFAQLLEGCMYPPGPLQTSGLRILEL